MPRHPDPEIVKFLAKLQAEMCDGKLRLADFDPDIKNDNCRQCKVRTHAKRCFLDQDVKPLTRYGEPKKRRNG